MENLIEAPERKSELDLAVEDARELAQEQVAAAWQLHVDRVKEQLESGWREQIAHVFGERFEDVRHRLQDNFDQAVQDRTRAELEPAVSEGRKISRGQVTADLNQAARSLRLAENREAWTATMISSAEVFCGRAALFSLNEGKLRLESQLGMDDIEIGTAPAFGNAIQSQDVVIALAAAGELSEPVANLFGADGEKKVYLFPLPVRQKVVAVLYAEPGESPVDASALELLSHIGAAALEVEAAKVQSQSLDLIRIEVAEHEAKSKARPASWTELSKTEQEVHLRAQRFARTKVAQMMLYRAGQVKLGRASRSLYATLREEIDGGRDAFREQFMAATPSMVDYYHLELVRTLASEDADLLGPDYSGPLLHAAVL